ncbi:MAG: hypothetical protein JWO38_6724 [Gemmataceae bacterium]|nr:hypothetical protein [Gemmataceae bacterium]
MPTVTCPKCEKVQRVPWGRGPRCAQCGTRMKTPQRPLPWWGYAISIVLAVVIAAGLVLWRSGLLIKQTAAQLATAVPTPAREGVEWRPDQLNGYLRKKGFQLKLEDQIDHPKMGSSFTLVAEDGREVKVRQFLKSSDAAAGAGPWKEGGDTFAWGTFVFTGDPALASGIRRVLVN